MLNRFLDDPSNEQAVHDLVTLLDDTFVGLNAMMDDLLIADISPIGLARVIWDHFHGEADRRFQDHPTISARTNGQQKFISVGDVNIRLSMVSRDDFALTANPTRNNRFWDSGVPGVLPGYDVLTTQVHLGYVPLDSWTKPEHVVIGVYRMLPGKNQSKPHTYREIDLDAVRGVTMAPRVDAPLAFRREPEADKRLRFKKTQDQLTIEEQSNDS